MANERYVLQVYVGALSPYYEALSIEASKQTTAEEIVECISEKLNLKDASCYELAEAVGVEGTDGYKETRLNPTDFPVSVQLQWPKEQKSSFLKSLTGGASSSSSASTSNGEQPSAKRFCLRKKQMQCMNWSFSWTDSSDSQSQLLKDYFSRFLYQPKDKEYPDLCQLPDLTEQTLLENLKARFEKGHIYTYVGSILIAVNPFKFFPIYNPKYVQHYQNRRLGDLPPHIFAIADAAYQAMLRKRYNQVILISGESGSGKTESTNLLLHHLTALSQKGLHGTGVEQIILGAGPVLESFGNSKTQFNNNSSRFGKFIQVNYKENGMVHSAIIQKYLLEKSRIVSQAKNERNYHVFYYLLAGASQAEKESLYLTKASDYQYLNQSKCYTLEGVDEAYEYSRLKQSLEMVKITNEKHKIMNSVISAVLHLGNVEFTKKSTYHCDEAVMVKNQEEVAIISKLLMVKEETLMSALTCKRTKAAKGETIIINYKTADAIATRDAMAKCLYGCLFEWVVMQVNQALLVKKDLRDHKGYYIGVLDIFGFEDFGDQNHFEQFNINMVNEKLHHYFNQHIFKYEQEEYQREDINWTSIDFYDNIACLRLIESRPNGLLCLLDDQCNFPGANNQNVLQKFVNHHKDNPLFEVPPCRQSAFVIKHYAGKVKYQIKEFREKNLDLMRSDIVCLLKSSSSAFVRELVGQDPLSIFRWQILKAFFKAYFIFTKLREESKVRRAAQEAAAANSSVKPTKKFDFESKKIGNESKTAIKKSNRPSIASNSAFQRFHNSILNANNSSDSVSSSTKTQPRKLNLVNNGTIAFSRDENGSIQNDANVLHKAHKILQKSKLNRPPSFKGKGIEKSIKNLQTLKAIVGKNSSVGLGSRTGRKQTPTVTFQFQQSLNHLMETLNQANPFFVRCIKSNTQKQPNNFDDMLVLVQLRYTGMLETVRIRQSGYSVRLTFEEFIQHYRILLPKGLLSSRNDIKEFLERMHLNQANYQMGKSKVFMRESEKLALDDILHQEILRRIITLQRWVRTWITYKKFNQLRHAVLVIQKHVRRWLAQQRLLQLKWTSMYEQWAATTIQKTWKAFKDRNAFVKFRNATVNFQAHVRGFLSRQRFRERLASFHKSRSSSAASTAVTSLYSSTINTPMVTTTVKHVSIVNSASRRPSEEVTSRKSMSADVEPPPDRFTNFTHFTPPKQPPHKDLKLITTTTDSHRKFSDDSSSVEISEYELNQLMNRKKSSVSSISSSTIHNPLPLPPRKQSQISTASELSTNVQADDELFEEDEEFESGRLDRSRNKPLRKLSIKRSKSSKIQSYSLQEEDDVPQSAFEVIKSPSETDLISKAKQLESAAEQTAAAQPQKNAFQKAKKQLKTLIIGGSSKSERKSKENLLDSDQATDDQLMNSSRLKKQSLDSSASVLGAVSQNSGLSSAFHYAIGHNLVSYSNHSKGEICSVCENNIAQASSSYSNQNLKCSDCDLLFHSNCSSSSVQIPCVSKKSVEFYTNSAFSTGSFANNQPSTFGYTKNAPGFNPSRPPRNKYRNKPTTKTSTNAQSTGNVCKSSSYSSSSIGSKQSGSTTNKFGYNSSSWNVTRTVEFSDPFDILITDVTELHYMEIFIGNKLCEMEPTKKKASKESMIDVVFKNALKEFKANLISTYSVASSQDGRLHITYKSLIEHFEHVVTNVCQKENTWKSFPVIMGVNAFRGYLDEFRNLAKFNSDEKPKYEKQSKGVKRKRGKKKVVREDVIEKHGHKFHAVTANIPTVCEICQSLMWLTEKIWVCKECKLTVHKKCVNKITADCRSNLVKLDNKKVFGAALESLVGDENQIPMVLEKLITAIELKGLYTEGIYRKSGTTSKINELKQKLENCEETVDLDSYSVHVITASLKAFFREMPEPLMTFDLYQSFLLATAISDTQEKVQTLFGHINKLPRVNYDVLERLIFHLARVAQQESANRMNANSLAIVFAPCVLRTDKPMQMQDKLSDISKQTAVLECIINERLRQVRDTLDDIFILDKACHTASSRLSSLRLSKLNLNRENSTVQIRNPNEVEDEEAILAQQIKHLRTEKALLTNMLPSFRLTGSDEDLLSNADIESSMIVQDLDDFLPSPTRALNFKFGLKEPQPSVDLPNLDADEGNLRHLTKNRVAAPSRQKRRLPSKFSQASVPEPEPINASKNTKKDGKSPKDFNGKSKFETKKSVGV